MLRRVALITTLTVALAIVLSNVAGYVALRFTIEHASQGIALKVAQDVVGLAAADVRRSGTLGEDVRQSAGVLVEAVGPGGVVARVPSDARKLVLEQGDAEASRPGARTVRRTGVDTNGTPFVVVVVPLEDTGYALVIGRPMAPTIAILNMQRLILLCVCTLSILASALVAARVTQSALRPVYELTAAAQHVTDTNDLQPITIRYATGELAGLAASFNLMLKSLTRVRERQSRLVADAGHELRTPLTSLRTNVDLLIDDRKREAKATGS